MRTASVIARYLLGLLFAVTGASGILQILQQPLPANPIAVQLLTAAVASHFAVFFFAVQLVAGLLLLTGLFVPVALILLAAELYNILAFHLTLAPGALPAVLACVLWTSVFLQYRQSFQSVFEARPVV